MINGRKCNVMCSNFKQSVCIFTVLINFNHGKGITKITDHSNNYTSSIRWLDSTFMNGGILGYIKQITKSSKNVQGFEVISRINEIVSENTKYSTNILQKAKDNRSQIQSGKKVSVKMLSFKPVLINIKTNNINEIGTKSIRHESISKINLDAKREKGRRQLQHTWNYNNGNFNPSQVKNPLRNRNVWQRWPPLMNMQRQVGWRPPESFRTTSKQSLAWRPFYTEHPYIKGPGGPPQSGRHPLNTPTFSQEEPYKVETQTYRVDKNLLALRQNIDVEGAVGEIQGANVTVITTAGAIKALDNELELFNTPSTTRLRFTTITTTTTIRRRTASFHRVLENYCDYHAFYCLKAYDTGHVCARTRMNLYTTFRNYCEINFVNCIEGFTIWQVAHMGQCQALNTLSQFNEYINQDDKFLEEYYVSLPA